MNNDDRVIYADSRIAHGEYGVYRYSSANHSDLVEYIRGAAHRQVLISGCSHELYLKLAKEIIQWTGVRPRSDVSLEPLQPGAIAMIVYPVASKDLEVPMSEWTIEWKFARLERLS